MDGNLSADSEVQYSTFKFKFKMLINNDSFYAENKNGYVKVLTCIYIGILSYIHNGIIYFLR